MHEATPWSAAFAALGVIALLAFGTWLASLKQRDVSLVDRMWSVFIFAGAATAAWCLPWGGVRNAVMLMLAGVWALRLALYVTVRNWGHGEDRRYQAIRARNQPGFAWKSLVLVFALQALLAWAVAAPFFAAFSVERVFGPWDGVAGAVVLFGLVFETVGDAQLARFKADPASRGQVMDQGLWHYTRHPNYFGECCVWWGFFGFALAAAGVAGWWAVVSPIVMTVLLLKVSGVRLLEQDIGERRPAYRAYIERTNAFFPGPPRR